MRISTPPDEFYAEIVQLVGDFCDEHLTPDYREYCLDLATTIRNEHAELLSTGRAQTWAAGIVYTAARENSLFYATDDTRMSAPELARRLGVTQATAGQRSNDIMDALGTRLNPPAFDEQIPAISEMLRMIALAADQFGPPSRVRSLRPEIADGIERAEGPAGFGYRVVGGPPAASVLEPPLLDPEWIGLWHITDMGLWDASYFNAETQAFIGIDEDGSGGIQFGQVQGDIDGKVVEYQEFTRFEFTWFGIDMVHPAFGSGWMQDLDDGGFIGELRLHAEYDSTFTAEKRASEWGDDDGDVGAWEDGSADAMDAAALMDAPPQCVYQIKVTLRGIKPPIWRRVLLLDDTPLDGLHTIIQAVMGWYDSHLHQFIANDVFYEMARREEDGDFSFPFFHERRPETGVPLSSVLSATGKKIRYEYDFGDGWDHDVLLEKILPLEDGADYPVCTHGRRACPPEDCGGPWGYRQLLETLDDPTDSDHEGMLDWTGGPIDPDEFDLDAVNSALRYRTSRKRGR